MKHPSKEQWMDFVYGESADTAELRGHLASCEQCRADVEAWRGTMRTLDTWKLDESRAKTGGPSWVRWAAAAAVLLGVGIAIGATLRKGPDVAELQRSIQALEERADRERATTLAALQELEQRRVGDLIALRRDLEQVAVATDAGLKMTQSQLVQLASYPASSAR